MLDDQPDLARLQGADEMPAQPARRSRDLLDQILGAVLTDQRHAGLRERLDVLGADVLDGHEHLDPACVAPGAARRALDAGLHRLQVGAHQLDAQASHANPP